MRKSDLFRQFRIVVAEVYQRNKVRWQIEAMSLMNQSEIIEVYCRHDFPGEGWSTTGLADWINQCADHRATAKDFKVCFARIWKARQDIMSWRAEEAAQAAA